MKDRARRLAVVFIGVLVSSMAVVSCANRDLQPLNPCTVAGVVQSVKTEKVEKVDLLFVIDKSKSMATEQRKLAAQVENMVKILTSGDLDGDGAQDFEPAKSLRVAVATTDLGAASVIDFQGTSNCRYPGDDGVFAKAPGEGALDIGGCAASYNAYQQFDLGGGVAPADFARDIACVAKTGTEGCGFEQQFESMLKSITPAPVDANDMTTPRFADASGSLTTVGKGNSPENQVSGVNFIRDDALLAVIMLADEDDCSVSDPNFYVNGSPLYSSLSGNVRCGLAYTLPGESPLHPIQRYVDGLLSVKKNNESLIVFGAITGVKQESITEPLDFNALLADSDMKASQDPATGSNPALGNARLKEICIDKAVAPENVVDRDKAYPATRIAQLAQELDKAGVGVVLQSICEEDYSNALGVILKKIADALGGTCLSRELNRDASGLVNCTMTEQLPLGMTCDQLADRGRGEVVEVVTEGGQMGAEICRLIQRPVLDGATIPTEAGWYYDDFTPDLATDCENNRQRLAFSNNDSKPVTGSIIRFECLQTVTGTGAATINSSCTSNADCQSPELMRLGNNPFCSPLAKNTCQLGCESAANCPGGYVCPAVADGQQRYCVNPTCSE